MASMIDVLKEVEPSEVVGQILASPKIQMIIGAGVTGGGTAIASSEALRQSDVMFYLGAVAAGMGILLTSILIVRNLILIAKDLRK